MANSQSEAQSDLHARRPGIGAWLLISPLLAWLLLFVVVPTAILVVCSFSKSTNFGDWQVGFTLENFRQTFSKAFLLIFLRSILYATVTTLLCALIGYPVAYLIGRSSGGWRNTLLFLVMIP